VPDQTKLEREQDLTFRKKPDRQTPTTDISSDEGRSSNCRCTAQEQHFEEEQRVHAFKDMHI
jgi:hypothetical protein